jgi:hypothetical protein
MGKEIEVYQFNNLPLFISLICSHMIFNSSSLFMSISNLILLYNVNVPFHVHVIRARNLFLKNN